VIQPLRVRAVAFGRWRAALPFLLLTCFACNQRPADAREWRPSDHDHTDNPGSGQVQVDPADAGAPVVPGFEDVTLVAWKQNCTSCHGAIGHGDGPRGPMLKATNLSDPAWQSSVTDEQIAKTIKLGKGQMPAFNLPDVTIANLVRLVRILNVAKLEAHAQAGASAAPSSSTARQGSAAPSSGSAKPRPLPSSSVPAVKLVTPAPKPSAAE
jgi:cytochrome c oxidase cbb3-type subunit 3